jgi:hypothetical protein
MREKREKEGKWVWASSLLLSLMKHKASGKRKREKKGRGI